MSAAPSSPADQETYPEVDRLYDPRLSSSDVFDYLLWVQEDQGRYDDVIDSFEWRNVGMASWVIHTVKNEQGIVVASAQGNGYFPDLRGNGQGHAHSKDYYAAWIAMPHSSLEITRYKQLSPQMPHIPGASIKLVSLGANNVVDKGHGGRPIYNHMDLGEVPVLQQSQVRLAGGSHINAHSTEVHSVTHNGPTPALSLQIKGPEEDPGANSFEGLVHYKGLTPDQAEEVQAERERIHAELRGDSSLRLGPATLTIGDFDTKINELSRNDREQLFEDLFHMVHQATLIY